MKNILIIGGILTAIAGTALAGGLDPSEPWKTRFTAPSYTDAQKAQMATDHAKAMLERPGFHGESLNGIEARKTAAKQVLAGPKTAAEEEALRMKYLKAVADRPGFLGEPLRYIQTRQLEAIGALGR